MIWREGATNPPHPQKERKTIRRVTATPPGKKKGGGKQPGPAPRKNGRWGRARPSQNVRRECSQDTPRRTKLHKEKKEVKMEQNKGGGSQLPINKRRKKTIIKEGGAVMSPPAERKDRKEEGQAILPKEGRTKGWGNQARPPVRKN